MSLERPEDFPKVLLCDWAQLRDQAGRNRARAKRFGPNSRLAVSPTVTIPPSAWMPRAVATSKLVVVISVVTLPSPSKEVSRLPFGLYRARAKRVFSPPVLPPATILLSSWIATALAPAAPAKGVVTFPSPPKEVSRAPSVLY